MLKQTDVDVFVDWQSQISNAGQKITADKNRRALSTLEYVTQRVASTLIKNGEADIYRVDIRLYHGWHRGLTPTENFEGIKEMLSNRMVPLSIENVSFDWSNPFGHTLSDAFEHRKHRRLKIHLPDTLREDLERPGREREKMVDTALVCDVLQSARIDPVAWRIIMAEDDDLVPAALVAEKWTKDRGGRTTILRNRRESRHVGLSGILLNIEA
jgi:hypothetical protein